jgi:DGQHR domain-containing protein
MGVHVTIRADVLRTEHVLGNDRFPVFIGFMTASHLDKIAVAPCFDLGTTHEQIAKDASQTPVKQWQRPLDGERVKEIARVFSQAGEIMPNAVLLAAPDPDALKILHAGSGNLFTIEVDESQGQKLWILDGQHRIGGLSVAQATSEIPFVLLASNGNSASYQDSTFAKIFAQVTTTAEGLHPLHNEWLTYAFSLGKYDASAPQSGSVNARHKKAMNTTIEMCSSRWLDQAQTKANPFFDRIAFNPKSTRRKDAPPVLGPSKGGFQLDATKWEAFIYQSYYAARNLASGELSPSALASEIGKAYDALVSCHQASTLTSSVLLGAAGVSGSQGHKALQDGFLHGVLAHLALQGAPDSWDRVLRARAFDTTNWTDRAWTGKRQGKVQTVNKNIAKSTFVTLLGQDLNALFLPGSSIPTPLDLRSYFTGAVGACIQLQARRLDSSRKKIRMSNTDPRVSLHSGNTQTSFDIGTHPMIEIGEVSANVQDVEVTDNGRPRDKEWMYQRLKKGLEISSNEMRHTCPLSIRFLVTYYGGQQREFELLLNYK